MSEKKKKSIFTPTKESTPAPSSPRKPILLLAERETKEEPKEKSDRPTTIILKTREQSASKDEWPVSPKNQEVDFPQPSKIAYNELKEKKIEQRPACIQKSMTEPIKLLDENLDMYSPAMEFLSETNTHYVVIGVIGTQGVGKSLVLNLLSQDKNVDLTQTVLEYQKENDVSNLENNLDELSLVNGIDKPVKNSWLKFKMQKLEHLERNSHCTKGIDMYVTQDRIIYLDCQALWSPSLVEEGTGATGRSNVVMAGLQLASFIMSVCHVVIAVQDWIVDYNFIRYIQTAEMLKPTLSMPAPTTQEGGEATPPGDTSPHLLLLHNRCGFEDYLPKAVGALQDVYRIAFEKSSLQMQSGMYMYSELSVGGVPVDQLCKGQSVETCGAPINLFLLPEINDDSDATIFQGHPGLDELVARLRRQLLGASRHQLTNVASLTEKAWYHFCYRGWETIRTSSFFIEYERLLP